MMDDDGFYYGDEKTQNDPRWDEIKDPKEEGGKRHMLDEVISVLRALVNIFDIISSNFNKKS